MAEVEADATRAEPGADPFVGTVLNGRFHIVKRIARGGMGSVYFATQAPLSRPVAVKVLHVLRSGDAEPEESFRRRFLQEASILAKLQHPNIVMLLDYGQIADSPSEAYFMAMEFLRGETLAQRFKAQGRLSIAESLGLARQIGRGLREAHRCGFIHRDLKPSNIMLVPEDETTDIVKLVDFGIGKIVPNGERGTEPIGYATDETRAGILLGSPRYMAPEQIRSEPVEPRTDLYGLGVILFQALTGRVPFDGASFDVLLAHCLATPPRLQEICPEQAYPESLSRLVQALLEKEVTSRPTVEEFLQQLAAVEEEVLGAAGGSPSQRSGPVALATLEPSIGSARPSRRAIAPWLRTEPRVDDGTSAAPPRRGQHLDGTSAAPPRRGQHLVESSGRAALSSAPSRGPARRPIVALSFALFGIFAVCVLLGRLVFGGPFVHVRTVASSGPAPGAGSAHPGLFGSLQHEADSFPLTIDSTPPGATVSEDGKAIGVTPVTMTVGRDSVVAVPRRFVVQKDGYSPYTLEQGDADAAVQLHATLAASSRAEPPARTPAARPRAQINAASPPLDVSSAKRSESSGLEIRLRR